MDYQNNWKSIKYCVTRCVAIKTKIREYLGIFTINIPEELYAKNLLWYFSYSQYSWFFLYNLSYVVYFSIHFSKKYLFLSASTHVPAMHAVASTLKICVHGKRSSVLKRCCNKINRTCFRGKFCICCNEAVKALGLFGLIEFSERKRAI